MNEQQGLYLEQARSDFRVYGALDGQSACHRLHYLQMCAEKLGKAYFWRTGRPPKRSHAYFVKFLRAIASRDEVGKALGIGPSDHWEACIRELLPLASALENLAPDLAGDGPNPEYPWPPLRPMNAPVSYDFPLWREFRQPRGRGHKFLDILQRILDTFPTWGD